MKLILKGKNATKEDLEKALPVAVEVLGLTLGYDLNKAVEESRLEKEYKYWKEKKPLKIELEDYVYALLQRKLQEARDRIIDEIERSRKGGIGAFLRSFTRKGLRKAWDFSRDDFPTEQDLRHIDDLIETTLKISPSEAEAIAIRGILVGRILQAVDRGITPKVSIQIFNRLPETVKEVMDRFGLSELEALAYEQARLRAASMIRLDEPVKRSMRDLVQEGIANRWGTSKFISKYLERFAELNRDARRIAITEAGFASANGYIARLEPGTFVVGQSAPDACPWCRKHIHGKVLKVVHPNEAPGDYSDLEGKPEYFKLHKRWEREVWVGKTNYGRSLSKRKRMPDGSLVERPLHEQAVPVIPAHPHCRCSWQVINPETMYVDEKGKIHFASKDVEAWKAFVRKIRREFGGERQLAESR